MVFSSNSNDNFYSATSPNVTSIYSSDVELLKRQSTADDILSSCNAEFPKRYEDRLTHIYLINERLLDDWAYGPTYQCCKADAEVIIDFPPIFPQDGLK